MRDLSFLNRHHCAFSEKVSVDAEDRLDDFKNGEYGYRVFYDVSSNDIRNSGGFTEDQLSDDEMELCGGQVEFTVDKDGNQVGEVLLWVSLEDEEHNTENTDFVDISDADISELVDDFNRLEKGEER